MRREVGVVEGAAAASGVSGYNGRVVHLHEYDWTDVTGHTVVNEPVVMHV